ncbi:MAG: AAA family ATPase, partial [Myxococcota bacterium]
GGLCLIEGDPGIGKTRLARELAESPEASALRVAWGRGWEAGRAPSYFLWTQVLRQLLRGRTPATPLPSVLEPLVGETDVSVQASELDRGDDDARFRLQDALASWLLREAEAQPILLVLDDLHAVGVASVQLLQFVARQLPGMRVLVVGTRRPILRQGDDAVAEALAKLGREATRLPLAGLPPEQSRALVAARLGDAPSDAWCDALHRISRGNPLLLEELTARLPATADEVSGPDAFPYAAGEAGVALRESVRERLAGLAEETRRVVRAAAVVGTDFDVPLLAAMVEIDSGRAARAVDEALSSHLLVPSQASGAGFAFAHDLFRENVYDALELEERARLHELAGIAFQSGAPSAGHRHEIEAARHWVAAVRPWLPSAANPMAHATAHGAPDRERMGRARDQANRAAELTFAQNAYEDACELYRHACRIGEALGDDEGGVIESLIGLARAERDAGDLNGARRSMADALTRARAAGAPELFARAAITGASVLSESGSEARERIALLEEALAGLPEVDSGIRALTLGRLAEACYFAGNRERVEELGNAAVEMARRLGDRAVLANTLASLPFTLWGPDTVDARLSASREAIQLAGELDRGKDLLSARMWRSAALLEIGDLAAVDEQVEVFAREAERFGLPKFLWHAEMTRGMRALMSGRLSEVAGHGERAMQYAGRTDQAEAAIQFLGSQQFALRRERGDLAELEPFIRRNVAELEGRPIWQGALSLLYAETDRPDAARKLLDTFAPDFSDLPRDGNWLASCAAVATACFETEHATRSRVLYAQLEPYADRNAVIGNGAVFLGPVARFLGMLASAAGEPAAADAHFAAARIPLEAAGATQLVTRMRFEWALSRARRDGGSVDLRSELAAIEEVARACDMHRVAARTNALSADLSGRSEGGAPPDLDRAAFSAALRKAMRVVDRPDLLKENPLTRLAQAREGPGASTDQAAAALGDLIRAECETFRGSAHDEIYFRVLERTYFGRPTKQQEAAADLALSYATYRRHHAEALRRLGERLWARLGEA